MMSYDSDLRIMESDDPDEIAGFIADIRWRNTRLGSGEKGYEVRTFEGSRERMPESITEKATAILEARLESDRLAEEKEAEEEKQRELHAQVEREKAILAQLQRKYPDVQRKYPDA